MILLRIRTLRLSLRLLGVASCAALSACARGEAHEAAPRLATVTRRDLLVTANAAGVIEPISTVEVKSQASGEITEIHGEEGDAVREGQLLVRVDPRVPRSAVDQARADSMVATASLENADAQLVRAESLYKESALTAVDLQAARLTRATAFASLVRAQSALVDANIAFEQTEVRAPTTGIILERDVEPGTVIAAASRDVGGGTVLLKMATLDTVQVRALVDETDIGKIHAGMPVRITVAAFPARHFAGNVLRIGAQGVVQQNVTMFPVLVRIHNDSSLLRPGMSAEVEVDIEQAHNVLAVPNSALRDPQDIQSAAALLHVMPDSADAAAGRGGSGRRGGFGRAGGGQQPQRGGSGGRARTARPQTPGGNYLVFTQRGGVISTARVRTGLTDFDYSEVVSGLAAGDTVVIVPTAGLLDDQAQRQQFIQRRVGNPLGG